MFDDEFYHKPPSTDNIEEWKKIIEESMKYAPPETRPGEKWIERVPMLTKDVNRTDSNGDNKNLVRFENPGDRENTGSFQKGIDVRELPPHTLENPETNEDDLNGGYGRFETFAQLGYKVWLIDRYEPDEESRSEFQKTHEDVREDSALSSNGRDKGSIAKKKDYVGVLRNKIDKYQWDKSECENWFEKGIKHSLSRDQIRDYIKTAIREENAKNRMNWPKDYEVNQYLKDSGKKNVSILNTTHAETGNDQRFVRSLLPMMKSYNKKQETQKYCLYNTQADTHEKFDLANGEMVKMMTNHLDTILRFASLVSLKRLDNPDYTPYKVAYRVTQKIGKEKINQIVDYPES